MSAEALHLSVEPVDIEPGLLVGRDDQAVGGRCGVAPDRRIVGSVLVGGDHRLGLRDREDRHRRIARRGYGRAGGKDAKAGKSEQFHSALHQKFTLTPAFIVQLYSSYW